MTMQKPIRHLQTLEITLREFGRKGEKLRETLRKALNEAELNAVPSLKKTIDFLDFALNEALSLQEDLSREAREQIYSQRNAIDREDPRFRV